MLTILAAANLLAAALTTAATCAAPLPMGWLVLAATLFGFAVGRQVMAPSQKR